MMNGHKQHLLHRAKIVKGHFDKIIKMIEDDEYCLNITQQTHAVKNALNKIDKELLRHHLQTCVREAIETDKNVDEKVNEVLEVFERK